MFTVRDAGLHLQCWNCCWGKQKLLHKQLHMPSCSWDNIRKIKCRICSTPSEWKRPNFSCVQKRHSFNRDPSPDQNLLETNKEILLSAMHWSICKTETRTWVLNCWSLSVVAQNNPWFPSGPTWGQSPRICPVISKENHKILKMTQRKHFWVGWKVHF